MGGARGNELGIKEVEGNEVGVKNVKEFV